MRVVIIHESPEADSAADEFASAAEDFNRDLDIRLRFLDVGFTLRRMPVASGDDYAAVTLSETVGSFRPGAILALGGGARLLECVSVAVKAGLPVVFLVSEDADRTAAAMARIADLVVVPAAADLPATLVEGQNALHLDGRPTGRALVDIIVRSVKERQRP